MLFDLSGDFNTSVSRLLHPNQSIFYQLATRISCTHVNLVLDDITKEPKSKQLTLITNFSTLVDHTSLRGNQPRVYVETQERWLDATWRRPCQRFFIEMLRSTSHQHFFSNTEEYVWIRYFLTPTGVWRKEEDTSFGQTCFGNWDSPIVLQTKYIHAYYCLTNYIKRQKGLYSRVLVYNLRN